MKIDKAGKVSGIKKQEIETLKTILIGILKIFAVFLIGVKKSEKCKSEKEIKEYYVAGR